LHRSLSSRLVDARIKSDQVRAWRSGAQMDENRRFIWDLPL